MFHKTVYKAWNLFNLSEQSPENSAENSVFSSFDRSRGPFNRSNALFNWSNRNRIVMEPSRNSRIIFLLFRSIKTKFRPIENPEFQIFTLTTLWNKILQTQTSLLQPIHVHTYIYNSNAMSTTFSQQILYVKLLLDGLKVMSVLGSN